MQVAQVARKRGTGVGVEVRGLWFVRYERERACCMVMWLWGSGAGRRAGIRFVTVAVADTGGRYLKSVPLNNKNKEPCSNRSSMVIAIGGKRAFLNFNSFIFIQHPPEG